MAWHNERSRVASSGALSWTPRNPLSLAVNFEVRKADWQPKAEAPNRRSANVVWATAKDFPPMKVGRALSCISGFQLNGRPAPKGVATELSDVRLANSELRNPNCDPTRVCPRNVVRCAVAALAVVVVVAVVAVSVAVICRILPALAKVVSE